MSAQQAMETVAPEARHKRRLRPDVAAKFAARAVQNEIAELYAKPLEELTPEEIRKMKSAFLLGI